MKVTKVALRVDGIRLVGNLYQPARQSPCPMVCLCHGIPSGRPAEPGDGGYPALAERLCGEGFATLFFNFRGAGESGGNLDMPGWVHDLRAVIDYLWELPGIDRECLTLVGFSGGAAAAVCTAAQDRRVTAVAACACPAEFNTLTGSADPPAMVARFRQAGTLRDADFPPSAEKWLHGFAEVRPLDCVARIAPRPLLLLHGDRDEMVPPEHARRLFAAAGQPKELVIIEGAGHRLRRDERAVTVLLAWLEKCGGY